MCPYMMRRIWTHSCLANCTLHVVFLTFSATNKFLKGFRIFLKGINGIITWTEPPSALHDFDRPSGCEKKQTNKQKKETKYEEKKIAPEVHQIMSQPIYKNILPNGFLVPITQITKEQFVYKRESV